MLGISHSQVHSADMSHFGRRRELPQRAHDKQQLALTFLSSHVQWFLLAAAAGYYESHTPCQSGCHTHHLSGTTACLPAIAEYHTGQTGLIPHIFRVNPRIRQLCHISLSKSTSRNTGTFKVCSHKWQILSAASVAGPHTKPKSWY